jgi:kynurenine formamidase
MTSLWPILNILRTGRFVDLTHPFHAGSPHASDMPEEKTDKLYTFERDGFEAHLYQHVGQWGTHVDPPRHYSRTGRSIDQISVEEMVLPLVVFDCEKLARFDEDYRLDLNYIRAWEQENGLIAEHSFAAMKTGWSSRWPSPERMFNRDNAGVAHFPGWSPDAVKFLLEERHVLAFGHETTDTDGGVAISRDDFTVERMILEGDRYQIELLDSLSSIPPTGSIVISTFPKPRGGSGYPARVFAICPNDAS